MPTATDDTKTANEDTQLSFPAGDLTANDDPGPGDGGQSLTVTQVNATVNTHGTVTLASGTITYTPNGNYSGLAAFTYQVCDNGTTNGVRIRSARLEASASRSRLATTRRIATNDSAAAATPSRCTIAVRANDTDVDGDTLTIQSVTTPAHGTAVINLNPQTITYTASGPFAAADGFDYTISDGHGGTDTGRVDRHDYREAGDRREPQLGHGVGHRLDNQHSDGDAGASRRPASRSGRP